MSRRTLRKIDPSLDVTPFLRALDDLRKPWTPSEWFERDAPLEIDIGSGKGMFLATASAERPDHNFLGVEISGRYARFCAAKLARRQASNARVIHGNAKDFLRDVLLGSQVTALHVYFPDPWWKKRHKRRRVMDEPFVRDIQRALLTGGKLHFWTDVEEYFTTTLELIAAATELDGPHQVPILPPEHDLDYRTHFERRMRLHGELVFRAEFVKRLAAGDHDFS